MSDDEAVEQIVTYHTVDGSDWPIKMSVEETALALEEFHGYGTDEEWRPPTDSYTLSYANGRMVHLKAHNVVALEIENVEDLINAPSRSTAPPAKSRKRVT
jgi:hypothetical protein